MGLNLRAIGKRLDEIIPGDQRILHDAGVQRQTVNNINQAIRKTPVYQGIERFGQGAGSNAFNTARGISQVVTNVMAPTLKKNNDAMWNQAAAYGSRNYKAPTNPFEQGAQAAGSAFAEIPKFVPAIKAGTLAENAVRGSALIQAGARPVIAKAAEIGAGNLAGSAAWNLASGKTDPKEIITGAAVGSAGQAGMNAAAKAVPIIKQAYRGNPVLSAQTGSVKVPTPPAPKVSPTPPAPKPEVAVKQGPKNLNDTMDEMLRTVGVDTSGPQFKQRKLMPLYRAQQKYDTMVDAGRAAVGRKLEAAQSSDNELVARVAGAPRAIASRTGMTDDTRGILDQFNAGKAAAGNVSKKIQQELGAGLDETDLTQIKKFLAREDLVQAKFGQGKIGYDELTPKQQSVVDKLMKLRDQHNEINFHDLGKINEGQYLEGKGGKHAAGVYNLDEFSGKPGASKRVFDNTPYKGKKDATQFSDEVLGANFDEVTSTAIRNEVLLRNKAAKEALDKLSEKGAILDKAPNSTWVQLDGRFGEYAGKWAHPQVATELTGREVFISNTADQLRGLLDAYRATPLGTVERVQKSFKTTLSPGTIIGNISSNIALFSRGSKINPITHSKNMAKAFTRLQKANAGEFDEGIYAAQKAGLDIGNARTGFELNGQFDDGLATLSKNSKNPLDMAGRAYGNMDDASKLAMFEEFQRRGLDAATAARRTNLFSQDYNNVGRLINMFADSPIMGKPFARFSVELLRLAKNSALYNPVGVTAGLGAFAIAANKLSEAAGESIQDRINREDQVGQTKLPGTAWINKAVGGPDRDLSLNLAVPVGEGSSINIARVMGLNFPAEPGKDASTALLEQLLPFPVPVRQGADGQWQVNIPEMVSSLALKPVADQIANRDFMGRKITDPENIRISDIADKNKFEGPDGKPIDDGKNDVWQRVRAAAMSTVPMANEFDNLINSVMGKEDYYGKQRTVPQAVARTFGLKVDPNNPQAREKRQKNKDYFEGDKAMTDKFIRENKDLAKDYYRFNDPSRTRDNVKTSDLVSPERWSILKNDTSGRLYTQLKKEALADNQRDGKPVDPIYQLSNPDRVKEIIELRSRPTGDDIEREEILRATTNWYGPFEKAERDYYKANDKFYEGKGGSGPKKNPRVEAYQNIPFPEQSALVQRYYQVKESQGEQAGKDFFKANADQLSSDFDKYRSERLKSINAKRAIEGFAPISEDTFNNVTFGYEDDERKVFNELKYGKGYGGKGYGSGGGGSKASNPYKYEISLSSGKGSVAKPKVSVKSTKGKKAVAKKTQKPKVTIQKSKV